MKTTITLFATILLVIQTAFGQEASVQDSAATDSVEVVITPKKGQDSTIVKVGGMKIIVLNDNKGKNETIIVDKEQKDDEEDGNGFSLKGGDDDNVSHWAGVRIGVNGYLYKDGLPIPATHDFLELDYAKSVSLDVNLLEKDFRLYKQYVELVTGLGMHFANYSFKNKYTTLSNTDPLTAIIDSTRILDKNKLKATYITAPLMIGFSTNKDEGKAFKFAAGAQVSWRIASKVKQQYSQGGLTYKPKYKSDFDLNPFLFHAIASVGYGPVNVFASYGLNSLFENKKTLAVTPFDLGLQFMF